MKGEVGNELPGGRRLHHGGPLRRLIGDQLVGLGLLDGGSHTRTAWALAAA